MHWIVFDLVLLAIPAQAGAMILAGATIVVNGPPVRLMYFEAPELNSVGKTRCSGEDGQSSFSGDRLKLKVDRRENTNKGYCL